MCRLRPERSALDRSAILTVSDLQKMPGLTKAVTTMGTRDIPLACVWGLGLTQSGKYSHDVG